MSTVEIVRAAGAVLVWGLALGLTTPARSQGLFEQAVSGEVESSAAESAQPSESRAPEYELNGYLRADLYAGKVTDETTGEVKAGYGEAALKLRARKGSFGDAYGELRFASGRQGDDPMIPVDLREAYINTYVGPLDVRFGHQIIAWGRADGVNPTDNLTPRDMSVRSPNEDDRRLANLAMRATLSLPSARLETVWVPFYRASRFPDFELPDQIVVGPADNPDAKLSHGTGAIRLHVETAAFEGSVSYLRGYAPFPGIDFDELQVDTADPTASRVVVSFGAYEHHVVGADLSLAVGDWVGLRGEAAYRYMPDHNDSAHQRVPHPEASYVIGVDKELFTEVSVIVQYVGRYVFDWSAIESVGLLSGDTPPDLQEILPHLGRLDEIMADEVRLKNRMINGQLDRVSHGVSARIAWTLLQQTLSLELYGLYELSTEAWFLRPKMRYEIADALAMSVGGEIFGGPEETLFGTIDETHSAGFVELRAAF